MLTSRKRVEFSPDPDAQPATQLAEF